MNGLDERPGDVAVGVEVGEHRVAQHGLQSACEAGYLFRQQHIREALGQAASGLQLRSQGLQALVKRPGEGTAPEV